MAVLIAPLVMAVLLFVPKFFSTLSAPLLVSAILFLIVFCFIFFWDCVWISAAISHLFGITGSNAMLVLTAVVQLSLTLAGSSSVGLATHSFDWWRVLKDGLEQTAAFVVAYLVYRVLRRPLTPATSQPVPNQRLERP
jgi:hypothetical protein